MEYFGQYIACVKVRGCPCAACVFPFGFSGQPVGQALLVGQPAAEGLGVVPVDIDNGFVVFGGEIGVFAPQVVVQRIEKLVLVVRDLEDAGVERPGYGDVVYGFFIEVAIPQKIFSCRIGIERHRRLKLAHFEGAGFDANKLHPDGINKLLFRRH